MHLKRKNIIIFIISVLFIFSGFIVNAQSITLVSPNGGEVWEANTNKDIVWTGTNIYGSIYIEYSLDGGQNWQYLYWGWSSDTGGTHTWLVPFIQSTQAKIRLTYWDNQTVKDESNNIFEISMPSFALIYPNGGETFYVSQTKNIEWIADNSNTITIEYSTDNGNTWDIIVDNIAASLLSYQWTIPNTPSVECLVRIIDDDVLTSDISNFSFTIAQLPTLEVVYPNGGETFEVGDTIQVEWSGTDLNGGVGIDFSEDNGQNWSYVSWVWSNINGGTYNWIVPNIITTQALINVRFWDMQSIRDSSDNVFSIELPSFALLYPNGGESFYENESINIQWVASNANYIKLEYSIDNGDTWLLIANNVDASLGQYSWLTPYSPSNVCLVRITDADTPSETDVSNQTFIIKILPEITLLTPNGGEVLEVGNNYTIEWTGHDINGNIYIEYSINSGTSWNFISWAWGNNNGGTFDWTIPNNVSDFCKVRVTFYDYPSVKDTSDNVFIIQQPSFMLIAPNGYEMLYANSTFNIEWIALNTNLIKIELSTNNGLNWSLIEDNVSAQQNTYTWTIPNIPSQQCLVRITDTQNQTVSDISNNVFSINEPPTIQLIVPNGGESYQMDDICNIQWSGTNLNGGIYIEGSYDGGNTWAYIAWVVGNANGGNYLWTIPNSITNQALIRVKLWDYPSIFDVSDGFFNILEPDFAFITPQGNETYYPNTQVLLEWYANNINEVNIEYSIDNGTTWISEVNQYDASLKEYLWTVPNTPSNLCIIKLTDVDNTSNFIISNIFSIKTLPVIEVLNPNGGEIIDAGSIYQIVWSGSDIEYGLNIELSVDNGNSWTYINSVTGTTTGGSYDWQVPYLSSNTALIRLTMWNYPTIYGQSDNIFSIQMPSFVLIQPNGGQSYYPNQQTDIQWSATNSDFIRIEYTYDNGNTWDLVQDSVIASLNIYTWIVPNTPSVNCLIKITDIDVPGTYDISNGNFEILNLPSIQIISPNGGETYTSGQAINIEWTGSNIEGNIFLEYSKDGGATYQYLAWAWGDPTGGSYSWTAPFINSSAVLIRAKFWQVPSVIDYSNAPFTIQLPPFVLISPNGNESLYPGNIKTIEWNAVNSNFIKIEYSIDDGSNWTLVQDSVIASSNTYAWTVPNTPSNLCKIRISDVDDPLLFDLSNLCFVINNLPTINIVSPNGGELLTAGTNYVVEWTGTDINSSLLMEYTVNGGSTWQYMGWGYSNTTGGTYNWTVPFYESQLVKVKATLYNVQSVFDVSDSHFSIELPSFALISPNGGSNYYPGSNVLIQWIAQNTSDIKIEYSSNNGFNWNTIINSIDASLGSYNWTIPNTPSNSCLVRITDINNLSIADTSDNVFTIMVLPTISLQNPTGGEILTAGDTINVTWTGTNLNGNVVLEFTTNNWLTYTYIGGLWGQPTGGTIAVTVPFVPTTTAKVRARMLEAPTVIDETDTTFSIIYPPFSLVSPNGLEQLYPTNVVPIKWFAANVTHIRLDYSIDNGNTWINIEQSLNASTGIFQWTVPNTPSIQCLVKVTDVNDTTNFDKSNLPFTIKTLPTIQLNSPIGGEILVSGTYHTIQWTGTNLANAVKIYYSTDLGLTWYYINEIWSMTNGASFQWFVPYTPSNNVLVKVFMYDAPAVSSQSNSVFSINYPQFSLIKPNGTEIYYPFTENLIKWVCSDSVLIDIELTTDNMQSWQTISSGVPASLGEYLWLVPNIPSDSCRVRISKQNNPQAFDVSDTVFSIQTLPVLSLLTPNGGEVLTAGTIYPVEWNGENLTGPIIIECSFDNWATSHLINWKYGNNTGDTLNWIVPFTPTTTGRLHAYYYQAPVISDTSDAYFTIVNPPFALISPSGGESFFPSTEVYIQWVAENTPAIKIEYSTDNGNTWVLIASQVDATLGVYNWIVPNTPSAACLIKITDELNSLNTSISLFSFTINPFPSIQVITPNGGEQFVAGNTYPVEWSGTNLNGAVSLEYSIDSGLTWNFIENFYNMAFGNIYYWQVPFEITTQAMIKASFLSISNMYDVSDNVFSIVNPSFAITSPNNAGLYYYPYTPLNINWIATSTNYIKILFSSDNGQTWTLIQDSVDASIGTFSWTLPNTPSSGCKIRIVDVNDNLIYDTSDNTFSIMFLPQLDLIKPNGGETYTAGDTIVVEWTGAYLTGGLFLKYSIDTGATWINITSKWGNPNGDYYYWIAPPIIAKVLFKLEYIDIPSINDYSDSLFTICFNPELYVTDTPSVCQPNTVDISDYFIDSTNAQGFVSYWYDSAATQAITNPQQIALSGIYFIKKETLFGTCSDIQAIEVVVGNTPLPPDILSTYNLCSADTADYLYATGQNIQWYGDTMLSVLIGSGDSINTSQFISDTVLYITQYTSPACPSDAAIINISYFTTPQAPTITTPPSYCAGDSIGDLIVVGTDINWYNDSLLSTSVYQGSILHLAPLYNDTVFYITQTENNCESQFIEMALTINPVPPKPTISQVGYDIVSSSTTGNQWFNYQGTLMDTNQYFTPPVDGFYYVIVTINGCVSDTSDIIYYYITDNQLLEITNDGFLIYPNPSQDNINIYMFSDNELEINLQVFNVTMQLCYEKQLYFDVFKREEKINIHNLPVGIYTVVLKNNESFFIQKIIKQ